MEYSGAGDARKTLELLWGVPPHRGRGPRPKLTVEAITRTAIALADAEGWEAVSMRRLAEQLGVTAMSLYKHVPGKAELLDLMVDAVYGEATPAAVDGPWRARLAAIAHDNQALYRRHPWLLQISLTRPVLGPHALAKYDRELGALEGLGLSDVEMDAALTLVLQFVSGAMRSRLEAEEARRRTGMSDAQWWEAHAPLLETLIDPERFPLATRVGSAAGEAHGGPFNPAHAFEFGLQRVLDGLERYLDRPD